jgi:hypothetical protein
MLTSFVFDADLIAQYTKIMSYLPAGQSTYAAKIALAFELVLNELRSRGIEPRRLHLPIDLNRDYDSSIKQDQSISFTKAANGNSNKYAIGMSGFMRFVMNISALSGTNTPALTATLQGSNDVLAEAEVPANWNTVTSLSFTVTGTKSIVFAIEYKYYRLAWTITGTNPSFTFTAGIVETCFDQLIIQKTFTLIYQEMSKGTDDIWYDYMRRADQMFESVMDLNDDNLPVKDESDEGAEVRFTR